MLVHRRDIAITGTCFPNFSRYIKQIAVYLWNERNKFLNLRNMRKEYEMDNLLDNWIRRTVDYFEIIFASPCNTSDALNGQPKSGHNNNSVRNASNRYSLPGRQRRRCIDNPRFIEPVLGIGRPNPGLPIGLTQG